MKKQSNEEPKGEVEKPTMVEELTNDLKINQEQLIQLKNRESSLIEELERVKNEKNTINGIVIALNAVINKMKKDE